MHQVQSSFIASTKNRLDGSPCDLGLCEWGQKEGAEVKSRLSERTPGAKARCFTLGQSLILSLPVSSPGNEDDDRSCLAGQLGEALGAVPGIQRELWKW